MTTTLTAQITATETAEAVASKLQAHVLYLEPVHAETGDGYGTVWLAGEGAVIRIDHSAHNICWSVRTGTDEDDAWWGYGDRSETVIDRIVTDAVRVIN